MKRISFFLLPLALVFTSCHYFDGIRGDGNIKTENRPVGSFNSVDVGGSFEVYLTEGPASDIRIEGDANLMQYIVVRTEGDELKINTRDHTNLDPTGKIRIYISAPVFKSLKASGASSFEGQNKFTSPDGLDLDLSGASTAKLELDAPSIGIGLSGASAIDLKGQTKKLSIEGSGASSIKCYDLKSETTDLDVSGATDAEVFASVSLKIEASGGSDIRYKGSPSVNQSISGGGSVSKAD